MLDDPRHPQHDHDSTDTTTVSPRTHLLSHLTMSFDNVAGTETQAPSWSRHSADVTRINRSERSTKRECKRDLFFDLSKLRDMLMGTSGMAVVGLTTSVSVSLREAAMRYMHYCLFNRPLRIGMIPSTSTFVDPALAKLSVIPSLVPKCDGPSLSWDDNAYEGRVVDLRGIELPSFYSACNSINSYGARLPRGGAPTVHSMAKIGDPTDVLNHLQPLEGGKLVWFSSHSKVTQKRTSSLSAMRRS